MKMTGSRFTRVFVAVVFVVPILGMLALGARTLTHAAADPPGGDPARGAALFQQCAACHSVEAGAPPTGPRRPALWDRRPGARPGFGGFPRGLEPAGAQGGAPAVGRRAGAPAGGG